MALLPLFASLPMQAQRSANSPPSESGDATVANMASTYVPIENWEYAAIDRLASTGYIQTAFVGLRPWTRMEFARLIDEAEEQTAGLDRSATNLDVLRALKREFAAELMRRNGDRNQERRIESIDLRSTTIAGEPLVDGYHSAQTITNDYGRPYGRGENFIAGISTRLTFSRFAAYARTEIQQAGSAKPAPQSAEASIAAADFTPAAAEGPSSSFSRGRLLEGYVSFAFHNNQVSFGKQALWWGPGRGGPLLFSTNAEPVTMLRFDRTSPFELPGIGRALGPIRVQAFIGRLSGQQFIHTFSQSIGQSGVALGNQPFIHGQKISFKPTPNFEFSVSRTAIFAGAGAPLTTGTILRSLFSAGNSDGKTDPGDRRSAVDVQYRVPKLRRWLTAYLDTFTDDEPFPLNYPTESAWSPGLYLSHIPSLPRLDLRVEGFLTPHRNLYPGFYYSNIHYLSGYTNERRLIGSWIGREAHGIQLWNTWWISPRSSVQVGIRQMTASSEFLRGGNLFDVTATADLSVRPEWQMRFTIQSEHNNFPLFDPAPQRNIAATFQLTYRPARKP